MNVRITAVVLLMLVLASAAQKTPKKKRIPRIPSKKRIEILEKQVAALNQTSHDQAEAVAAMAKLQAEQHDEVMKTQNEIIDLLKEDDFCPNTATPTTPTTPACYEVASSSLGGAACDNTTEGGPWLVVQRRTVGDVQFDMPWAEYKKGFGDLAGDFWIGNDALNELCPPARPCQLMVELTYPNKPARVPEQPDGRYVALYGQFAVANATELYRLSVSQFNSTASTAGNSLTPHNNFNFSTLDADHDRLKEASCSPNRGMGGWWFGACTTSNLNGRWAGREFQGLLWYAVTGARLSATGTRMLVRLVA